MNEVKLNWYLREFTNPACRMALEPEVWRSLKQELVKACREYKTDIPHWLNENKSVKIAIKTKDQVLKAVIQMPVIQRAFGADSV